MKIIAGSLKNKKLSIAKNLLRPTTDKVRGAIFNIIEANFPGIFKKALVCDIFAGSGAMGIEAISRGASKAIFIENNRTVLKYLKENLQDLLTQTDIIPMDAIKALEILKDDKFDVIFLDPPYNKGLINPTIAKIGEFDMIKRNGIIVIEHHKKEVFAIPDDFILFKNKEYSDTTIKILCTD